MNSDRIEGNWHQMVGAVKEKWGKLTDDDLKVIEGSVERLVGKVQERYGVAIEEAQKQVEEWKRVRQVTATATTETDLHRKVS